MLNNKTAYKNRGSGLRGGREMKECITHHHACDCREDKFKELKAENERLREKIEILEMALKHAKDKRPF